MRITVACAAHGTEAIVTLDVAAGTTVEDAVDRSAIIERTGLSGAPIAYAIFGRRVDATRPVEENDRVEITLPLICDPKLARRRRAARKG
jgi:Uncharacterized protein conserved in bacteria